MRFNVVRDECQVYTGPSHTEMANLFYLGKMGSLSRKMHTGMGY